MKTKLAQFGVICFAKFGPKILPQKRVILAFLS